jgi:hypothetical protein
MAAVDRVKFSSAIDSVSRGEAVTPHDTNELTNVSRALYVGVGGALRVITLEGDDLILVGVVTGTFLPIRVKQVMATGTTALSIVSFD